MDARFDFGGVMDIADIISRAESAAIPKQHRRPGRKRSVFLNAEQRERFKLLWHDGTVSLVAIAKEFGVCAGTAESLGVQYGYPPRSGFRVAWRRGNPSPASPPKPKTITAACPQCGRPRILRADGKKAADKAANRPCISCRYTQEKRQRGLGLRVVTPEKRAANPVLEAVKVLVEADWVPLKRLEYENLLNKMQRLERENEDLRAKGNP